GVTQLADWTFDWCLNLTSVTLPEGLITIGEYAFNCCESLSSITIPGSVTSIGDSAFTGCSLTSITIPNGVTNIGAYAFYNCRSLINITLPESMTKIGDNAFCRDSGYGWRHMYLKAVTPPEIGEFDRDLLKIYVPRESVEAYKSAEGWKNYADEIVGYNF
ncbi:MAG: leucine-rich repeat domain-containing protein, partial [Rikenellaceae bacterium]|nr:leucine-rich repeat domain-containing protein [Rikenellaceae bacterium]